MTECGSCGQTTTDGAPLCLDEARALAHTLRAVPDLLDDLDLTLTRQDRLSGDGGRRSTETPVPWKEQVPDVVWALGNTLTTWARDLAERRRLTIPRPTRPTRPARAVPPGAHADPRPAARFTVVPASAVVVEHTALWLADHVSHLRLLADAVAAHDEITDAIVAARRVTDRPVDRAYLGTCAAHLDAGTVCDVDLYAHPRHTSTVCPACHTEHDVAQRREQLRAAVADYLEWHTGTAAEVAGLLRMSGVDIGTSTIRRWAADGRMTTAGVNTRGHPLYRAGEVRQLLSTMRSPRRRVEHT